MNIANGFARLPTKLIAAIIDEVKDIKSLCSLARCSSLCYQVVLPLLYGDIQLTQYHHLLNRYYNDTIPHAYKLTCMLLRDPNKAARVCSLTVVRKYIPQPPHVSSILEQNLYADGIEKENLDRNILRLIPSNECDKQGNYELFTAYAQCRDSSVALLILLHRLRFIKHLGIATWLPPKPDIFDMTRKYG